MFGFGYAVTRYTVLKKGIALVALPQAAIARPPVVLTSRLPSFVFSLTQMQAVPCLVGGRDVLACAPTGSGKTLSFMLPMILRLATGEPCAGCESRGRWRVQGGCGGCVGVGGGGGRGGLAPVSHARAARAGVFLGGHRVVVVAV